MADLYASGNGVPLNIARAAELYSLACNNGGTAACTSAAVLFESGAGVPRNVKRAIALYERGCSAGDQPACSDAARLASEEGLQTNASSTAAHDPVTHDPARRETAPLDARNGLLGRANDGKPEPAEPPMHVVSGIFFGLEGSRVDLNAAAERRTVLTGGWGFGLRGGLDLWNWWTTNLDFRVAWLGDKNGFSQEVSDCEQQGLVVTCVPPHSVSSDVNAMALLLDTGVQHTFRLARFLGLAPGAFFGYAIPLGSVDRHISGCDNCRTDTLQLDTGAPYVAAALRFAFTERGVPDLGLSLRFEQFLAGDLSHALSLSFEVGRWDSIQ